MKHREHLEHLEHLPRARRLLLAWMCACACACAACPEPIYDAEIGVEGVPVEDGALAGAFALIVQAADEANVPGLGDQVGGGFTLYLVARFPFEGGYEQTLTTCQVRNFEVAGLTTTVSDETAAAIPLMDGTTAIDEATGAVTRVDFLEQWAIDPSIRPDEPLPEKPDEPGVVDMEGDGKPGATLTASGLANGEIYVNNRKTLSLAGVIRSADQSFGLTTHKKEGFVLAATDPILDVDAERHQHPDPKESWWHEVRIAAPGDAAASASCDDVDAAFADGRITQLRPF